MIKKIYILNFLHNIVTFNVLKEEIDCYIIDNEDGNDFVCLKGECFENYSDAAKVKITFLNETLKEHEKAIERIRNEIEETEKEILKNE